MTFIPEWQPSVGDMVHLKPNTEINGVGGIFRAPHSFTIVEVVRHDRIKLRDVNGHIGYSSPAHLILTMRNHIMERV